LYAARRECRLILPNEAGEYGAEYALSPAPKLGSSYFLSFAAESQ